MTVGSNVEALSRLYGLPSGSSGTGPDLIGALCYGALSFQSMTGTKEKKEEGMVGMTMAHRDRNLGTGHAPEHDIERLYCDVHFPRLAQATRLLATDARNLAGQTA